MNVNHHQTKRERNYFEWSDNMQITRKGKGEIAMTESELVEFFCVTWRKLNYRLQQLLKVLLLSGKTFVERQKLGLISTFGNQPFCYLCLNKK